MLQNHQQSEDSKPNLVMAIKYLKSSGSTNQTLYCLLDELHAEGRCRTGIVITLTSIQCLYHDLACMLSNANHCTELPDSLLTEWPEITSAPNIQRNIYTYSF